MRKRDPLKMTIKEMIRYLDRKAGGYSYVFNDVAHELSEEEGQKTVREWLETLVKYN